MNGLSLLAWKRLTNTAPTLAGAENGVTAFSGGAYDPTRRYFLFNGGGHLDGSGNGVFAVRVGRDTPDVVALMPNSASTQQNVGYYNDGKPASRHSYGTLIYAPTMDGMMQFANAATYGDGNHIDGTVNRFNLKTNTWDPAGTYANLPSPSPDYEVFTCRDDAGNIYVASNNSHSIRKWTPGTPGSWSTLWSGSQDMAMNAVVFDSTRQRIVYFGSSGNAAWFSMAGARTGITFSGPSASLAAGKAWVYCPERDSYIGVDGVTVLECNPTNFSVSTLSISGTAPTAGSGGFGGHWNRWQIDTSLGVIFFHASTGSTDLWAFRYK